MKSRRIRQRRNRTRKGGLFGFKNNSKSRNDNLRDCRRFHDNDPKGLCGQEIEPNDWVSNTQTDINIAKRKGRNVEQLEQKLQGLLELEKSRLGLADIYDYPGQTNIFGKSISYLEKPKLVNRELNRDIETRLNDDRYRNKKTELYDWALNRAVNSVNAIDNEKQDYNDLLNNKDRNSVFLNQTNFHV